MQNRRSLIVFFTLGAICLTVVYATYAQKQGEIAFQSVAQVETDATPETAALPRQNQVTFRQVSHHPVGLKPGEFVFRVLPNKMVRAPILLPPDREGNFWVMREVTGGIVRLNRSGQVVNIVRPQHKIRSQPSVNSSGHLALYLTSDEGGEIVIYSPTGQRLDGFKVQGCPQCKHPYCQTMIGLDDRERVWLRFLSSDRSVEEDPKQSVCVAAFDLQGRVVQHVEGSWAVDVKGRLLRRTKSIGGSYLALDPETMKTVEISVPAGWDGIFIGIDSVKERIWWQAWHLENPKETTIMAFDKRGIVTALPRLARFLGTTSDEEIAATGVVIGTDGRLYVSQTGKRGFYIFEADTEPIK